MAKRLTIRMLYPVWLDGTRVSHVVIELARLWTQCGVDVRVTGAGHTRKAFEGLATGGIGEFGGRSMWKLGINPKVLSERMFAWAGREGEVAYLWPAVGVKTYERVRGRGCVIVNERINCAVDTSRRILDAEYEQEGLRRPVEVLTSRVMQERAKLELSDGIFAPSPAVAQSLLDFGIEPRKILRSSYGWDPSRVDPGIVDRRTSASDRPFTVLFLGRGCIRKGLHLLLRAWRAADAPGRLLIAGNIDDELADHVGDLLNQRGVEQLGYVRDVGAVLEQADVFAFPTLEEGSPLAKYEAMGAGLAMLVSPMGGGDVVRSGVDGWIVDPHAIERWADALRELSADRAGCAAMGCSAAARASEFVWEKVARRRLGLIQGLLGSAVSGGARPGELGPGAFVPVEGGRGVVIESEVGQSGERRR